MTDVFGTEPPSAEPTVDVTVLHAKIGKPTLANDLYVGFPVKRHAESLRGTEADQLFALLKGRGVDRHRADVSLEDQLISGSSMTACHNPACTAQTLEETVSHFLPVQSHQSYSRIPSPRFQIPAET